MALSPHAPYSTPARLLRLTAAAARQRKLPVATHVAESETEFEMFRQARGEMFDWLKRNERDMNDCGGVSPVQHLARQRALGPHLLAVHVNHLARGDAALLAKQDVSVAHCPRSHEYFKHHEFPFRALTKAGVNVCLGTDSLATVRKHPPHQLELSLFHEMRTFASAQPHVSPATILQLVTLHGARALGLHGKIGELKRHAFADLIALPYSGKPSEACEAVVQHTGKVAASMIAGRWALAPG
jgi:cytosine/adenosine deaminase-related metal-dependent hydrolase